MAKEYILNGQRIYIKLAFNIIYFGKLISSGNLPTHYLHIIDNQVHCTLIGTSNTLTFAEYPREVQILDNQLLRIFPRTTLILCAISR